MSLFLVLVYKSAPWQIYWTEQKILKVASTSYDYSMLDTEKLCTQDDVVSMNTHHGTYIINCKLSFDCAVFSSEKHFCSGPMEPETPADYDFAQQELMIQQMGNDPIQEAITEMEKQHESEKMGMSFII